MTVNDQAVRSPTDGFTLRDVIEGDIPLFFGHQLDPEANRMAAFTSEDPADRTAFVRRWRKILADDTMVKRTILLDGTVAGHIVSFERFAKPEVTYWIGREHWGRGIATRALRAFLADLSVRPLYARAATDNVASLRVLQKCGFTVTGRARAYANAHGKEIEEAILTLV